MEEVFGNYSILGKPIPRVDARAKVTGEAKYAADYEYNSQQHSCYNKFTGYQVRPCIFQVTVFLFFGDYYTASFADSRQFDPG